MAYNNNARVHHKHRKARRVGLAAFVVLAVVVLGGVIVGADWFINQKSSSNTVVTTENTTSVQSVNVSVYRTEYFQFQAPEEWRQVVTESTDTKFVYVKNDKTLITQKLVVHVNRSASARESDLKITNVVPVNIINQRLEPISKNYISDHCSESWPQDLKRNPDRITHDNVSFVCAPDSDQYNLLVGQDGGLDDIKFEMTDGTEVEIAIVFSDLTAYPSSGDLFSIIRGFQVL